MEFTGSYCLLMIVDSKNVYISDEELKNQYKLCIINYIHAKYLQGNLVKRNPIWKANTQ